MLTEARENLRSPAKPAAMRLFRDGDALISKDYKSWCKCKGSQEAYSKAFTLYLIQRGLGSRHHASWLPKLNLLLLLPSQKYSYFQVYFWYASDL